MEDTGKRKLVCSTKKLRDLCSLAKSLPKSPAEDRVVDAVGRRVSDGRPRPPKTARRVRTVRRPLKSGGGGGGGSGAAKRRAWRSLPSALPPVMEQSDEAEADPCADEKKEKRGASNSALVEGEGGDGSADEEGEDVVREGEEDEEVASGEEDSAHGLTTLVLAEGRGAGVEGVVKWHDRTEGEQAEARKSSCRASSVASPTFPAMAKDEADSVKPTTLFVDVHEPTFDAVSPQGSPIHAWSPSSANKSAC